MKEDIFLLWPSLRTALNMSCHFRQWCQSCIATVYGRETPPCFTTGSNVSSHLTIDFCAYGNSLTNLGHLSLCTQMRPSVRAVMFKCSCLYIMANVTVPATDKGIQRWECMLSIWLTIAKKRNACKHVYIPQRWRIILKMTANSHTGCSQHTCSPLYGRQGAKSTTGYQ